MKESTELPCIMIVFCPRASLHCKLRHEGCSSAQRQVFHRKQGTKVAVLLGMTRRGNFPLLSATAVHKYIYTYTHTRARTYIGPNYFSYIYIYISVFCPRAGPSLQVQEPRLQFCRRQVFHRKLRNQGCSFIREWIGAVASRCFPHPTLSLASE